jgi:adenylate cyclase, class 2
MIEVEAKVRISLAEYRKLATKVATFAKREGETLKVDRYYGHSRSHDLRIRQEGSRVVLAFKNRNREKGIEANEEIEIPIVAPEKWERLLAETGFPRFAVKEKRSLAFRFGPYHIELNRVKGLGCFLEIERLVSKKIQVPEARRGLVALFKRLGYSPRDFERKLYLELLAEKEKNRPSD